MRSLALMMDKSPVYRMLMVALIVRIVSGEAVPERTKRAEGREDE